MSCPSRSDTIIRVIGSGCVVWVCVCLFLCFFVSLLACLLVRLLAQLAGFGFTHAPNQKKQKADLPANLGSRHRLHEGDFLAHGIPKNPIHSIIADGWMMDGMVLGLLLLLLLLLLLPLLFPGTRGVQLSWPSGTSALWRAR